MPLEVMKAYALRKKYLMETNLSVPSTYNNQHTSILAVPSSLEDKKTLQVTFFSNSKRVQQMSLFHGFLPLPKSQDDFFK